MVGFYVASKIKHADKWLALRAAGNPVISSWIDEAGEGKTFDLEDLWQRCVREVCRAGAVLAYHEYGEMWKGALIEIGAALAVDIPVFVITPQPDLIGSWVNHHRVRLCPDVQDALERIRNL